jgi:hypothetical protein
MKKPCLENWAGLTAVDDAMGLWAEEEKVVGARGCYIIAIYELVFGRYVVDCE